MNYKVGDWVDFEGRNSAYLRKIGKIKGKRIGISSIFEKRTKKIAKDDKTHLLKKTNGWVKLTKIELILYGLDEM